MNIIAIRYIDDCLKTLDPHLDLSNCALSDDDFGKEEPLYQTLTACKHIEKLDLSNNLISKITGLENLTNLKELDFCENTIEKISGLENLTQLKRLNLRHNNIETINGLENLVHLQELDIAHNKISAITGLENLKKLNRLYLMYNQINIMSGIEQLTELQQLLLTNNRISVIDGLNNLTKLQYLHLDNNRIKYITGLENTTQLSVLKFNQNQITRINGLENLIQLERLEFYNNQIKKIEGLEKLVKLRILILGKNRISEISGLKNLAQLRILELNGNNITVLSNIENLTELRELDISENQISIVAGLETLGRLNELDLSKNEVSEITSLEKLTQLERLDLADNKVADIRALLPLLENENGSFEIVFKEANATGVNEINLSNNPLKSPPIEIVKLGIKAILNYFAAIDKQGVEYLYEAKMLIVGQPRAGKTSLRYKLFDSQAPLPTEDKTTRGIDIKQLNFEITDRDNSPRKFYYNIWDFGGQQIYQTTHQFFLTHRSLYILVIDTAKDNIGNDDNAINYWLQAIELLGGNSPLLLVRNEKNERLVNIDIPQKRARFNFLKNDYSVDFNSLIYGTNTFNKKRLDDFALLKEDIEIELKRLPLVGFPMPKNWMQIRNELNILSRSKHYIERTEYIQICEKHGVHQFERQMELSSIFHDLGIFLHFQEYSVLEDFIILQNTWATDAVFAVLDNKKVQDSKGKFSDMDLSNIWKDKEYEPKIHNKLLALMMKFELCYQVDKVKPFSYIVPEMLSDSPVNGYQWQPINDMPLQYRYDFMPKGILTRLTVRLHKHIATYRGQQVVWKRGVKIDGTSLDCPNTIAEIIEAWDNKQLLLRVQGPFARDLMSKLTYQIDELNKEFFRQAGGDDLSQKSKYYKMIPCNCITCKNNALKHYYDYRELLQRRTFGKETVECAKPPFDNVNIKELIEGVFSTETRNRESEARNLNKRTIKIFLASSSELKHEREKFELFIGRENKRLNTKNFFLQLEVWEDFLDSMSKTRLQDEYNKATQESDIFIMLYFTKVGIYTTEEFEKAFKQFQETDKPKIFTYFKNGDMKSGNIERSDVVSLLNFQDKLKELGHFQTVFESHSDLHLHFKKQLERLYDF